MAGTWWAPEASTLLTSSATAYAALLVAPPAATAAASALQQRGVDLSVSCAYQAEATTLQVPTLEPPACLIATASTAPVIAAAHHRPPGAP